MRRSVLYLSVTLCLLCCWTFVALAQHQYHYDGPEYQRAVDDLRAKHEYMKLQVGATLTVRGRLFTITAVRQDGVALSLEGTIKNLTAKTMYADPIPLLLNESPDRQMKWFKEHPVTTEYHYGPGFNSHAEALAQTERIEPGKTGTFVAIWNTHLDMIAAEPTNDLVITF